MRTSRSIKAFAHLAVVSLFVYYVIGWAAVRGLLDIRGDDFVVAMLGLMAHGWAIVFFLSWVYCIRKNAEIPSPRNGKGFILRLRTHLKIFPETLVIFPVFLFLALMRRMLNPSLPYLAPILIYGTVAAGLAWTVSRSMAISMSMGVLLGLVIRTVPLPDQLPGVLGTFFIWILMAACFSVSIEVHIRQSGRTRSRE